MVFVPSSGDLFLIRPGDAVLGGEKEVLVFVPSSGDLFLIREKLNTVKMCESDLFSSPLLGICF